MAYKNPKELLVDAPKILTSIEDVLPEGAPAISAMLTDFAAGLPVLPDFPMEIPALPTPPELPAFPAPPGGEAAAGLMAPKKTPIPTPAGRGIVKFVYE